MPDLTLLIEAAAGGDRHASDQLLPLVYEELRKLAAAKMASENPGHTLNATALVHEAYLRLVGNQQFDGRGHFFAAAAEAMRRILVDRARARQAKKRGGDGQRIDCDLDQVTSRYSDYELVEVDSVVDSLAAQDAEAGALVRLHVFGGLPIEEAGALLNQSRATAYRNWSFARAWLRNALQSS